MSQISFKIPFGNLDLTSMNSEKDYERIADSKVDASLVAMGEQAAEHAWNELQKQFRNMKGFQMSVSAEKSRFIREGGANARKNASLQERQNIRDAIIAQVKEIKPLTPAGG